MLSTEEGCPDCPPALWRCLFGAGGWDDVVARGDCTSLDRDVEGEGAVVQVDDGARPRPWKVAAEEPQGSADVHSSVLCAPPTSTALVPSA
jgi:hypothetical protein